MQRRKRSLAGRSDAKVQAPEQEAHGACVVCGASDARLLTVVALSGGAAATLCGSHALMHGRSSEGCASIAELRAAFGDRRDAERRAEGDGDDLAERLTAAFSGDRRSTERRAG